MESKPPSEKISPPFATKRRRSSFRKSICPIPVPSEQGFIPAKRIAEAKQETEEWTKLLVDRRQQSKIADQALSEILADPPTIDFNAVKGDLTDEDLKFLNERPDYVKTSKDMKSFFEKMGMLYEEISVLNRQISCNEYLATTRMNEIAKDICNFNEVEPMWLGANRKK